MPYIEISLSGYLSIIVITDEHNFSSILLNLAVSLPTILNQSIGITFAHAIGITFAHAYTCVLWIHFIFRY